LQYLSIGNNLLTGSIPDNLGQLTNLSQLYLAENQLSGSIPNSLGNLQRLNDCNLSGNDFSCPIPTNLPAACTSTATCTLQNIN